MAQSPYEEEIIQWIIDNPPKGPFRASVIYKNIPNLGHLSVLTQMKYVGAALRSAIKKGLLARRGGFFIIQA